jgi:HKD family nuclease
MRNEHLGGTLDMTELLLHSPDSEGTLRDHYRRAFREATELMIVSAYLTEWDSSLRLNSRCSHFRFVIGKDFGITRKAACEAVMKWLPRGRKSQFLVATQIAGFHPKSVFWRDKSGKAYAIVGSSNLTMAAFERNYEANVILPLTAARFSEARRWVDELVPLSVPVSTEWLTKYREAPARGGRPRGRPEPGGAPSDEDYVKLALPSTRGIEERINQRRRALTEYRRNQPGIIRLFRDCAAGRLSSVEFYEARPELRMQARGWERQGKKSDFRELSKAFVRIIDADAEERDDIVLHELDSLEAAKNPARGAFLSEMLCSYFPKLYPLLNDPVKAWLKNAGFSPPRGASEGDRYILLARTLRQSLQQHPKYPAKNLAELDTIIWESKRQRP